MSIRDVYIAIMRASARGEHLRLTPTELDQLSLDDAISTRAFNALTAKEADEVIAYGDDAWAKMGPRKKREAANSIIGPGPDEFVSPTTSDGDKPS